MHAQVQRTRNLLKIAWCEDAAVYGSIGRLDWPIVTRPLEHGGDAPDVTLMLPTLEAARSTNSGLENEMHGTHVRNSYLRIYLPTGTVIQAKSSVSILMGSWTTQPFDAAMPSRNALEIIVEMVSKSRTTLKCRRRFLAGPAVLFQKNLCPTKFHEVHSQIKFLHEKCC